MDQELEVGKVYNLKGKGRYRYKGGDPDTQESWEPIVVAAPVVPRRQPGMTGVAAFGADPNYFNALGNATQGVVGEMAQGASAGFSDEMGLPRRDDVPAPVAAASQLAGGALSAAGPAGALGRRFMASFPSRIMGGGVAGAGSAAAYAAGTAESDRGRAALAAAPFGYVVGAGLPLVTGALGAGTQAVKKVLGYPLKSPAEELADALGERTLASTRITDNRPLVDQLPSQKQAEVAIRRVGPNISTDDAGVLEERILRARQEAAPQRLESAVNEIVAPGTSSGSRRQLAREGYEMTQDEVAAPKVQELMRRIRNLPGGTTPVDRSRVVGRSGLDQYTYREAQAAARAAKNSPYQSVQQLASELDGEVRTVMREGNSQWARAMRAEALDEIISRAEAAGDLSRRSVPTKLPNKLREEIERTLKPEEYGQFIQTYQQIARDQNNTVALSDALRAAYAQAFDMDDELAQQITAAAYLGAGQAGAASRTGIMSMIRNRGLPQRQASARERLRILLEEDPMAALELLRAQGPEAVLRRQEAGGRMGILSTLGGGTTGGLLGGGSR